MAVGMKELKALEERLAFSADEQELLRKTVKLAYEHNTYRPVFGGFPMNICQVPTQKNGLQQRLVIVSGLYVTEELFAPTIIGLLSQHEISTLDNIRKMAYKSDALNLDAAIIAEQTVVREHWYTTLLPAKKRSRTDGILLQRQILEGRFFTINETNRVLDAIRLLGKETNDAVSLYNGLDTIAYAALMLQN